MSDQASDSAPASGARQQTWLDAVEDVLDATIEREAEFECTFEELNVDVPLRMGDPSSFARWNLDGTVRVRVDGTRGPLSEWLRWWYRRLESSTHG